MWDTGKQEELNATWESKIVNERNKVSRQVKRNVEKFIYIKKKKMKIGRNSWDKDK